MVCDLSMADKKRKKKEHDFSVIAFRVVQEATEQIEAELREPAKKKASVSQSSATQPSTGVGL